MFNKDMFNEEDFNYTLPPVNESLSNIDDFKRISPFLNIYNPLTYSMYLKANKDNLTDAEYNKIKDIFLFISTKHQETMDSLNIYFEDREIYKNKMRQNIET